MTKTKKLTTKDIIAGVTYAAPCTICGEDHVRTDCPYDLPEIDITADGFHGILGRHVITFTATYPEYTSDWEFIINRDGTIETFGHRTGSGKWLVSSWRGVQHGNLEDTRRFIIACFALGGIDVTENAT